MHPVIQPIGTTRKGRPVWPAAGGAVGVGGDTLQVLPDVQFVTDPSAFMQRTEPRIYRHRTVATPGAGSDVKVELPQAGIISMVRLTFDGTATVATASVSGTNEWPYGLLSSLKLSVNGQTEIVSVEGEDLHALRYISRPSFEDATDQFPGAVGGGGTISVATHDLYLTYTVPLAMDPVTLVGSLYAQSPSTLLELTISQAADADLVDTPANLTIAGDWIVEVESYEVPKVEGVLVVPDLSRIHAINSVRTSITNTGENRLELIRSSGQLARLLISGERSDGNPLSAHPSTADASKVDKLSFEYGSQQRPLRWDPASTLVAKNNEDYGGVVPYDRLVIDTVRHNVVRDAIYLQGLTEAAIVPDINGSVTLSGAFVRLVQETLFAVPGAPSGNGQRG